MKNKPTKLEIHLYDALENLICQHYANGITYWGEKKAGNAMNEFNTMYGSSRHDGKWIRRK